MRNGSAINRMLVPDDARGRSPIKMTSVRTDQLMPLFVPVISVYALATAVPWNAGNWAVGHALAVRVQGAGWLALAP